MDLIQKAKAGDSHAFDELLGPLRPGIRDFLYRRLADWDLAEDLCQEVLVQAYIHMSQVQRDSEVKPWLFALAHRLSASAAQDRSAWSPDAVGLLEEYLLEHPAAEKSLQEVYLNNEEEFNLRNHVEFCFTVTSQSLLHQEREAFLLREFGDLSWKEIGNVIGKDAKRVEEEAAEAEDTLQENFSGKCGLVNRAGECTQCKDFGEWLIGPEQTQEQLNNLPLQIQENPDETFTTRIELVQELSLDDSPVRKFHKALLNLLRGIMGEEKEEEEE